MVFFLVFFVVFFFFFFLFFGAGGGGGGGGGGVYLFLAQFPSISIAGLLGIVYRKHLESIAKYLQVCHRQIR